MHDVLSTAPAVSQISACFLWFLNWRPAHSRVSL